MIRFLGVLIVLLLVIAGIGYYRGWFYAKSHDVRGESTVTVTVDKDKIEQDKASARQQVQELEHK